MTPGRSAPPEEKLSELTRVLIQQFYEDAVRLHGVESEQARMLLEFLNSVDADPFEHSESPR
jgi:hypothetical protein